MLDAIFEALPEPPAVGLAGRRQLLARRGEAAVFPGPARDFAIEIVSVADVPAGAPLMLSAHGSAPEVVEAVSAILSEFVEIDDLQRKAGAAIARLCQAEAGFVTASCSALPIAVPCNSAFLGRPRMKALRS